MLSRVPNRLLFCLLATAACGTETEKLDSAAVEPAPTAIDLEWESYAIEQPSAEINVWLNETPFLWPEKVCVDASTVADLPADAERTTLDDGTEAVCFWDAFSGNVPEGMDFTRLPPARWLGRGVLPGLPAQRVYRSDDALLDDAAFVTELEWVRDQVRTSGCGCCHASGTNSGHTSGFDMDAPGVWTDSMTNAQLAMAAGRFPEHSLFGHFAAETNHGFDREATLFASTDPARMAAFFEGEFQRRGGNDEDLAEAQGQFDALFGRLFLPFSDCITPYEGLVDGKLLWNSEDGVRQVYILETDAQTPGSRTSTGLRAPSGPCTSTRHPTRLLRARWGLAKSRPVPWVETGELALESGRTYRLYATPDVMIPSQLDCTFVAP